MWKLVMCWLYAITKYRYVPDVEEIISAISDARRLGFEYVELEGVGRRLHTVANNRALIKRRCKEEGVKIINFVPALPDLVSADSGRRRKALKDFKLGCGLASYLDADLIQVDSYYLPIHIDVPYDISRDFEYAYVAPSVRVDPDLDFWDYFNNVLVQSISECNDMAMGHGLKLCIEPRTWETISNVWAVELLMREVGSGNVGVVLDVAHLSAQKMNIVQCVEMLGSRIFYVHASDNDYLTEDHLEIGKGKVDWMNLLKALKKHSFSGFIGIDIGGKRELKPNLDEMYINSKRRLERMMKALAGSAEDK